MSNEQARQDALQVAEEVLDWYKTVDNDKADRALQIVRQALALPTAAPGDEREAFEKWWKAEQLKTFPKEYEESRLENWGAAYKPKAWLAWNARSTPPATLPLLSDDEMPPLHAVAHIEIGDDFEDVVTLEQAREYARAVEAAVRKQMGVV